MKKHGITARTPKLGIIFLVNRQLFIANCSLSKCEDGDEFKNYPGDHQHYWAELQNERHVSIDCEYEKYPRGRVVLNRRTGKYSLYLDRCILRNRMLVSRILSQLCLPRNTLLATDPHYRCFKCLGL